MSDTPKPEEYAKDYDGICQVDHVRLSVNLSPEMAEALRKIADRHNHSATVTTARAIAMLKFIEDEMLNKGNKVIIESTGKFGKKRYNQIDLNL